MKTKKWRMITILLMLLLTVNIMVLPVLAYNAEDLDIVIVIDVSGSMSTSDANGMISDAINMFINMAPAEKTRIAIVTFSSTAVYQTDGFVELDSYNNTEELKSIVKNLSYRGETGVGNGLKLAVDLLDSDGREDAQKTIMVFSDGIDNMRSQIDMEAANENYYSALSYCKNNGFPIYCIGFDSVSGNGTHSFATEEGIEKLTDLCEETGGEIEISEDINVLEEYFMNMLATLCDEAYDVIGAVSGDGEYHEIPINIDFDVAEANIRIHCDTEDAVQNGTIKLYASDGSDVELKNGDHIRYAIDKTAAAIKLINPTNGTWILTIDNIVGDDVEIGLLKHISYSLELEAVVPAGNEKNVVYKGDSVELRAYLVDSNGNRVVDSDIYAAVEEAVATIIPRVSGEDVQTLSMRLSDVGGYLCASYSVPLESVYDVRASVSINDAVRTSELMLTSDNKPLELTGLDAEELEVKVRKTTEYADIYQYVSDPEGDEITAAVTAIGNDQKLNAYISGDALVLEGIRWGTTDVTVTYTDNMNNTQSVTFAAHVRDPLLVFMLSIPLVVIFLIAGIVALVIYLKGRVLRGQFAMTVSFYNEEGSMTAKMDFDHTKIQGKRLLKKGKNFWCLFEAYTDEAYDFMRTIDQNRWNIEFDQNDAVKKRMKELASKIGIQGTFGGKKGFSMLLPVDEHILYDEAPVSKKIRKKFSGSSNEFTLEFLLGSMNDKVRVDVVFDRNVDRD